MADFKNIVLDSTSGYAMPFFYPEGAELLLLSSGDYDKQQIQSIITTLATGPLQGKIPTYISMLQSIMASLPDSISKYRHDGLDFYSSYTPLYALADGKVVEIKEDDPSSGTSVTIMYGSGSLADGTFKGCMSVKYSYLSKCTIGMSTVKANTPVGVGGSELLRIEARNALTGEIIPGSDFLQCIYGYYSAMRSMSPEETEKLSFINNDTAQLNTGFEGQEEEIEDLAKKYLIPYLFAIAFHSYSPEQQFITQLQHLIKFAIRKNFVNEVPPYPLNPAGVRAERPEMASLSSEFYKIFIPDFLQYVAQAHGVFLHDTPNEKKKS